MLQLRVWARVLSVCGSFAGVTLFFVAVLSKIDSAHAFYVSGDGNSFRIVIGLCLVLAGSMFAVNFCVAVSDEIHLRKQRQQRLACSKTSVLNLLYIVLLMMLVFGSFVVGFFVLLLTPLLWPLALMVAFGPADTSVNGGSAEGLPKGVGDQL